MNNSRRIFIKKFGTGILMFPLASKVFPNLGNPLKIGVLGSSIPSKYLNSFFQGLQLSQTPDNCIDCQEDTISLVSSYKVAQSLKHLQEQKVQAIISLCNKKVSRQAISIIGQLKIPFIQSGLGPNQCSDLREKPFYFEHTLNYFEAAFLAGKIAAEEKGKTAIICASLYDIGFDHVQAFRQGFESSGGRILDTFAIKNKAEIPERIKQLNRLQPKVVFGLFAWEFSADFLKAFRQSPLSTTTTLISNHPIGIENKEHQNYQYLASWSPKLDHPENRFFCRQFENSFNSPPNSFALLGFETGLWLSKAWEKAKGNADLLPKTLASAQFQSPRGVLRISDRQLGAPFYWFNPTGISLKRINPIALQNIEQLEGLEQVSGYTNPYLLA